MKVEDLLNRSLWTAGPEPCWAFCQEVLGALDKDIPARLANMSRIDEAEIGAVVLFRQKKGYHAGVVWPDCLHFVHARTPLSQPDLPAVGRKDRLSDPLYEPLIDGYYV